MSNITKSLFIINIAVLLFGIAGLFGKFLTLHPIVIVFGRTLFAWPVLLTIMYYRKEKLRVDGGKETIIFILLGVVLAIHWTTFFYSVSVSTVAIGLLSYSTFPVFVTFMEPLFVKEKIKVSNIITALVIFFGLILVIPKYDLSNNITQGVLWGVISGFTFALISILNRKYVKKYSATKVAFYQNFFASIFLLPFAIGIQPDIVAYDIFMLIILGIFCTAAAHTLFIKGMLHVKTYLASMIACLEPVYGVLLAILFFSEYPGMRIILGGIIIIGTTIYASTKQRT